jgi:sortase A
MAPGDTIEVTTGQGELTFTVDGVRRPGDPLPPPPDPAASRLTLVSGEGTGRLQSLVASSVVFVDATLDGEAQPAPPGRPTSISDDERLMSGDTSALVPLVLWLEVLLLAVVVLVWARARWGTWQTWVVGVPIVIAVGWAVTSTAFVLLPNVL